MSTASNPHYQAMNLVESAVLERMRGNPERTRELYAQALDLELAAIRELEGQNDRTEPTWSVLHRSAGWMAFNSNQLRRAEQLAATALAGDPRPDIAEELRELMEQVNSQRHLELRGVTLTADELQMSLSGPEVGPGRVRSSDLIGRVRDITRFVHRIVEYKKTRPFRGRGPRQDVTNSYPTFVSAPRSGSFSATITIGQPTEQLPFSELLTTNIIVDEFMDVVDLVQGSKMVELQERVTDVSYRQIFVGLARKLAPDGSRIRQVGFTSVSDGKERHLSIDTPVVDFPLLPVVESTHTPLVEPEPVEIRGVLRYADAISSNEIRVVDSSGRSQVIQVPEGWMNDIVCPHWDSNVTIRGTRVGTHVTLQSIEEDAES